MATQNGEEEAEKFYRSAKIQKEQLEKRIQDMDNIIRCLYEDRVSGRITPERYDSMASGYEQEQAVKKRELQELAEKISEVDMRDQCIQEFIRRIEVYEKFEKYSRTAGNPIRIHYAFRLPEQGGVPAVEVLAQPTAKTA